VPPLRAYLHQPADVHTHFPAQLSLNPQSAVNNLSETADFIVIQVPDLGFKGYPRLLQDAVHVMFTYSMDVP
jgi:hypothetical protein